MSNKKYSQETVDKALEAATRRFKTGGAHLGVVHRWMQYNFRNGDTVTWGSQECLTGTQLTPMEMEQLATRIMERVVAEFRETFAHEVKRLEQFETTEDTTTMTGIKDYCESMIPKDATTGIDAAITNAFARKILEFFDRD